MAAKKKAKRAVKKKPGRKAAKKTAKKAVKAVRKTAKKKAGPARKSARKAAPARKAVKAKRKSPPARKKQQIVGEGDYAASRAFDRDEVAFVKKNRAKIAALGKEAEAALDGPEGEALRDAEAAAQARSRDTF